MFTVSMFVTVPAVTAAFSVISSLEPAPPSIFSPIARGSLRMISSAPAPALTVPLFTILLMVMSSLPSPVLTTASASRTSSIVKSSPPSPSTTLSSLVPSKVSVRSPSAAPPLKVLTLARPPAPNTSSISRSCVPVSSTVVAEFAVIFAITFGLEPIELSVRSSTFVSSAISASVTALTETVNSLSEPDFIVTTRSSEFSSATVL